jgi:uncharacterized Fe-S cluster-containing radical SAM superfamily protein
VIDTDAFSARLRARAVRVDRNELLIANFVGSDQEPDLTDPPNCGGLGRVRHFHRETSPGWPANSLPIDPASAFLGLRPGTELRAQVFQNAACNWRCWYCFVPFNLLDANEGRGAWVTARDLVARYAAVPDRPPMIDLTGGQPDLVPEWLPWMMDAIQDEGLDKSVYLWSDDNLSNDYFWRYLDDATRRRVSQYLGYGRVCCFKGFDATSFAFNTEASPDLFDRQFELFSRLLSAGLDLYAYATFTAPSTHGLPGAMGRFVDRLQRISEAMPLRLVPLEIALYSPVRSRLNVDRLNAIQVQQVAMEAWQAELECRFSATDRAIPINEVPIGRSRPQ